MGASRLQETKCSKSTGTNLIIFDHLDNFGMIE